MTHSKKKTIHDLSREAPTEEELLAVQNSLGTGTHLVTAILGQAMVEHELESIIRKRFKNKDDSTWRRMTSNSGPLSSFSQKITMGRALAIYSENDRANFDIIKDIRNAFAHSKKLISFDNSLILASLNQTKYPSTKAFMKDKKYYTDVSNEQRYVALCMHLTIILIKSSTRSSKASARNYGRKIRAIQRSYPSFPLPGGRAVPGLSLAGYQTGDPKNPPQGLGGLGPLASVFADFFNKDK